MTDSKSDSSLLEMGKLLGRREAFGLVAGRCSAAEAACLKELHETKKYKEIAETWDDFCARHLRMSRASADRIIRMFDEFGPGYFELAQLTRIAPETYRLIAPAVKGGALHAGGEAIALIPENADKVAAAVAELRHSANVPKTPRYKPIKQRLTPLKRRCDDAIEELREIYRSGPGASDRALLNSMVQELQVALVKLKIDHAA